MKGTLKQTMSAHPMTVRYKDDLSSAYIRMRREGYRHMPVIDEQGDLIGLISDRDFQRAMWPMGSADAHGLPQQPDFRKGAKVCEYMSWPVKTLPEETKISAAVCMMIDEKVSSVVVTRGDQIAGIITSEDLLKILATLLQGPTLREKAFAIAYDSPLGKVAEILTAAGI
jgi:CBS domain-containing membrane protein